MMNWIPYNHEELLHDGTKDEVVCLVTCQEWDIFNGRWGTREVRVLTYSTLFNEWNTKSDIRVLAWMLLPEPFKDN